MLQETAANHGRGCLWGQLRTVASSPPWSSRRRHTFWQPARAALPLLLSMHVPPLKISLST